MRPTAPTPADPEAWNAYLAEGNAKQARKRVSADAIIRDPAGRVLLVNPTYKPGWDLPGGMAEANEAPEDAVARELSEELALKVTLRGLLVVDWVAPHGPWDDQLAFIFDCGTLTPNQTAGVRPRDDDGELADVAFVPPTEAATWLPERIGNRYSVALEAMSSGSLLYLRNGTRQHDW